MPAIRHAIIAIGALDKTLDIIQDKNVVPSPNLQQKAFESATHHRFALQQYGKSIKQMRSNFSTRNQDYRTALILCLLTICFEALNGDMQSALEQIRNGLKLIKEWRKSPTASGSEPRSSLKMQSPGTKELVRAFNFLDNNSIMIMNAIPVMGVDTANSVEDVPQYFLSFEDARDQFEVLASRMLHWIASVYVWGAEEKDEAKRRIKPAPPKVLKEQREKFLEKFRNWRFAFQPLWLDSQSTVNNKNFMTALALELRFKAINTCLFGDHFLGDTVYDALTSHFREIVDLAKIFVKQEKLQSDSQRAMFTFDDPFISSVYIVILKCREPSLRREAIALLQSHPRRDGVMDSTLMAKIGTMQMNIEEAESEGGYIPEHARIRGIKTTTDMVNRTGRMKYLKMASSSDREFVVHNIDFTW
jgi:hypothetical protein